MENERRGAGDTVGTVDRVIINYSVFVSGTTELAAFLFFPLFFVDRQVLRLVFFLYLYCIFCICFRTFSFELLHIALRTAVALQLQVPAPGGIGPEAAGIATATPGSSTGSSSPTVHQSVHRPAAS